MQAGHTEVKWKSAHASCWAAGHRACWCALLGNKKSYSDSTQIKSRPHAGHRASQQSRVCRTARTSHDFRLAAPDYAGGTQVAHRRRSRLDAGRHGRDAVLAGSRLFDPRILHGHADRRLLELAHAGGFRHWRTSLRAGSRPHWAHAFLDGLHPRLLPGQRRVRVLAFRHATCRISFCARARNGRRMDRRGCPHCRNLASRASRKSSRHNAIGLCYRRGRRRSGGCGGPAELWLESRFSRRRPAGALGVLDSVQRARARAVE